VLNTIDTLIAFVVVMLVVSMAVTTLTGMIGSALNLRGACLQQGVARLLLLIDSGLGKARAKRIAGRLLRDPLVARPMVFFGKPRLADTVHREELTKLMLEFAAAHVDGKSPSDPSPAGAPSTSWISKAKQWLGRPVRKARENLNALRGALKNSLDENNISDPEETLKRVREAALQLEQASPELSTAVRQNIALLNVAQSEFLAKINAWFDQTIDRVSDLFTARTRLVTAVAAVVLALLLQLDAIALLNRFHDDPTVRETLVQQALKDPAKFDPKPQPNGPDASTAIKKIMDDPNLKELVQQDLITVPRTGQGWLDGFKVKDAKDPKEASPWRHIFGILISAALLSLGAPFWYSALQGLLKLRSVVATRDDAERKERQTTQEPAAPPSNVAPPALVGSERGNLEAVG